MQFKSTISILPKYNTIGFLILTAIVLSSCATYYQKHFEFNKEFERGELNHALESLQKNGKDGQGKNRFIYYVNNGLLLSIMGKYEASNDNLEKAFLFGEDYRINYFNEAASYLTNPNFTTYRGEDHEHLMLLYFKALNFLKMNKPTEALVECRRLNIRLNQLSDKYTADEKLQRDAFIHTLMGIIYQSTKDFNNAFIAYRNALEVYENDYAAIFKMVVPEQLKIDLLNTAWWTGFTDEFEFYKAKFNMPDYKATSPEAELLFFWHNGLAPVKNEWGINFVLNHKNDNMVVFTNDNLGLSFPFKVENDKEETDLKQLEIFRVAFPKYVERPLYFQSSHLKIDNQVYKLQLAEDINQIAFYSLKQRMMQEFGKGLLRAALKKATEHSLKKEDDGLGSIIGLVNAITEKADTRNWQTLPHSIYYARVPLRAGENKIAFQLKGENNESVTYDFAYKATPGQTLFHTFSSLETLAQSHRYY